MLIQPFDFHWPSQHDSLWTTIDVSALHAYYIVVRKHSQSDELDHSGHGSPYTKALYILLASKRKNIKATINLIGPHLTAFINMQTSIFTLSQTQNWTQTQPSTDSLGSFKRKSKTNNFIRRKPTAKCNYEHFTLGPRKTMQKCWLVDWTEVSTRSHGITW